MVRVAFCPETSKRAISLMLSSCPQEVFLTTALTQVLLQGTAGSMAEIGKRAEKLILRNDFKLFYDALQAAEYSGAQERSFLPTITTLSLFSYQSGVRLSHAAQFRQHKSRELLKAQLNSTPPAEESAEPKSRGSIPLSFGCGKLQATGTMGASCQ